MPSAWKSISTSGSDHPNVFLSTFLWIPQPDVNMHNDDGYKKGSGREAQDNSDLKQGRF